MPFSRCDFVLFSNAKGFGLVFFFVELLKSPYSREREAREVSDLEGKEGAGLWTESTQDASARGDKESALKGERVIRSGRDISRIV